MLLFDTPPQVFVVGHYIPLQGICQEKKKRSLACRQGTLFYDILFLYALIV